MCDFQSTFPPQMFSKNCFCKRNIYQIVRLVLAAVSANGLKRQAMSLFALVPRGLSRFGSVMGYIDCYNIRQSN